MAKPTTIEVRIKISWWFKYLYLPGLKCINWITVNYINIDAEPNAEKINNVTKKAIKCYVNNKRI